MFINSVDFELIFEVKEAAEMARASRLSLHKIRSLTFLAIKIVDLMFRTNFSANIFVGF